MVDVCSYLEKDADLCAEEAEVKSRNQMAQLSKSNALWRRLHDKKEKEDLEKEITKKFFNLATLIILVQTILIIFRICNADEFGN